MKGKRTLQIGIALMALVGLTLASGAAVASGGDYGGDDKYDDDKKDKKYDKDKKKKHSKHGVPACKKSQGKAPKKNPHCKKY
ncbi:hypothetical protein ACFFQF_01890 [Haladaptatus pallidirubidus]|uniref:Uncharacterized protein n=1 Tax=Haladaptatus pallidirubidus TaxID=1008152 RepID=A0AAV3UBQ7_9EURY|nr:hypothetical protein [Haladaptatus pallidirubidus]